MNEETINKIRELKATLRPICRCMCEKDQPNKDHNERVYREIGLIVIRDLKSN